MENVRQTVRCQSAMATTPACCVCLSEEDEHVEHVELRSRCGHSVCAKCVDRIHDTQQACPLCRSPFPVYVSTLTVRGTKITMCGPTVSAVGCVSDLLSILGSRSSPGSVEADGMFAAVPCDTSVRAVWMKLQGVRWSCDGCGGWEGTTFPADVRLDMSSLVQVQVAVSMLTGAERVELMCMRE
jgi:hypothetical protein